MNAAKAPAPGMTRVIDAAVATIRAHADQLTALDQAIGDGDHGINMRRGFDAIMAVRDQIGELAPAGALEKIGMLLVMKVGGASGPLYGSFFMAFGKALGDPTGPADFARAFAEAVAAVARRGKSQVGEKTMLDVLVPVSAAFQQAVASGLAVSALLRALEQAAESGLASTEPMRATKGRASYLGERSIGHLDPGARSSTLLIKAVCLCFEERP